MPPPIPREDQALVAVEAFSINRGETFLLENPRDGWRPGQDVAGRVLIAAPDGSGPAAGTRVVGHAWDGGWACWTSSRCRSEQRSGASPYWPHDEPDRVDLQVLADLVATGRLHPEIGLLADWHDTAEALLALRERRVHGNAVLTIPVPQ